MQFTVLLTGVLVFVFYLFHASPVHWNKANLDAVPPRDGGQAKEIEARHAQNTRSDHSAPTDLLEAIRSDDAVGSDRRDADLKQALAVMPSCAAR
jgi:hypothetical protein